MQIAQIETGPETQSLAPRPMEISKLQNGFSAERMKWLTGQVAYLAEARQAAINEQTYAVYTAGLSQYDCQDIAPAIVRLSLSKRSPWEGPLPDLGTVVEAVREEKNRRLRAEREERERKEREAEKRDFQEHPENYVEFNLKRDLPKMLAEIRGARDERRAKEEANEKLCPHCGGELTRVPKIESLTPKQLRELADAIERQGTKE